MWYKYYFVVSDHGCVHNVHTFARSLDEALDIASLYAAEYGYLVERVEQVFESGQPVTCPYRRPRF